MPGVPVSKATGCGIPDEIGTNVFDRFFTTRHGFPNGVPSGGPCYDGWLSGLGLRAMGGRKPRQVRKEATVAVRLVCRGSPGAWRAFPRTTGTAATCTR